jgi:hypothetical protein
MSLARLYPEACTKIKKLFGDAAEMPARWVTPGFTQK